MSPLPDSRKAWRVIKKGSPKDAMVLEQLPLPKLARDEVLVRVQAAALNPVDYKMMTLLPNLLVKRPAIVGADVAGIVADANGTHFKDGEAVFGWNPMSFMTASEGALAEFVKVPASRLIRTPSNFLATEVAGIPLAGLTAYQGLIRFAEIQEGQSIFINGGSSSVGRFAIQIAKARGCRVTTSCSTSKIEDVKALGADEVIDYTAAPLHNQLIERNITPKFHAIFETIGLVEMDLFAHSPEYLAPNGVFVSVGPNGPNMFKVVLTVVRSLLQPTWLGGTPRKFRMFFVDPKPDDLEALGKMLAEGKLKCPVDSTSPFGDALKAFEHLQTGKTSGKVVIHIP